MRLPHAFSRRARKLFFFLHLWTGLIVGLWFVMMGLTGSVMAWNPQLIPMELQARMPYQKSAPDQKPISLEKALANYKKVQPDVKAEEFAYVITPNAQFPYYFFFRETPREGSMFLVDPYGGKVHEPIRVEDLTIGWISHFHANLLWDDKGLWVNGIGSAWGVILLLTGLWLWWPSNKQQLKLRMTLKRGAPLKRQLLDWHNVMGIYLFGAVFIVTLTGALLAFNGVTDDGIEKAIDRQAGAKEEAPTKVTPRGARLSWDELIQIAQAAQPGRELHSVSLPAKPDAPFGADFGVAGGIGLLQSSHVEIDPYAGRVLRVERDAQSSPGHKFMHLMHDFHFGTFGGFWSKLLYTLAGLMPLGLFITGTWRWWARKQSRSQAALREKLS